MIRMLRPALRRAGFLRGERADNRPGQSDQDEPEPPHTTGRLTVGAVVQRPEALEEAIGIAESAPGGITELLHPVREMRDIITAAGYKQEEVADGPVETLAYYWLNPLPGGKSKRPVYVPLPGVNWRYGNHPSAESAMDCIIEAFTQLPDSPAFREVVHTLYRSLLPHEPGPVVMSVQLAVVTWIQGRWVAGANATYAIGREFDMRYEDRVRTERLEGLYQKYLDSRG